MNFLKKLFDDVSHKLKLKKDEKWILISVEKQILHLLKGNRLLKTYPVSTAKNGVGFEEGSFKTPTGLHRIAEKIGDGYPIGAVFKSRKFTGDIARIEKKPVSTNKDLITTRILWLEGLEEGKNRGVNKDGVVVDTFKRYIYIHGTDEEGLIGRAVSHGCIRMKNTDIVELFNMVEEGTIVYIVED